MHYSDFDEHLHTLVLERGMEYFEKGLVTGLTHSDAGWTASVHGNDEYHIKIEGDDVIQQWYCSCPNEHGPVCKHVAATLFAIRDNVMAEYRERINEMSREELVERLLNIAKRLPESRRWI